MKPLSRYIDEWVFDTGWVLDGRPGDRLTATFRIRMSRPASLLDRPHSVRPTVKFSATLDPSKSSECFQSIKFVPIEDDDINKLRTKVQEKFEGMCARDWQQVILVLMIQPEHHHRNTDNTSSLQFSYLVCEKAGALYRVGGRDGHQTADRTSFFGMYGRAEDESIHEFPYDACLEATLASLKGRLDELAAKLSELVADERRLRLLPAVPALLAPPS